MQAEGTASAGDSKRRVGEHGAGSRPTAFPLWRDLAHSRPAGSKTHKEPWEHGFKGRAQRLHLRRVGQAARVLSGTRGGKGRLV